MFTVTISTCTVFVLQDVFTLLEDDCRPTGSCNSHGEDVLGTGVALRCCSLLSIRHTSASPLAPCAIGQLHGMHLGLKLIFEALELCQVGDDTQCRTCVHHQPHPDHTAPRLLIAGHQLEGKSAVGLLVQYTPMLLPFLSSSLCVTLTLVLHCS